MRRIGFLVPLLIAGIFSAAAFAQDHTWAFSFPAGASRPGALLDLRSLNEPAAGSHGFLGKSADGKLVFADGTPARFWCVNEQYHQPIQTLRDEARFLARIGVNMVRLHAALNPKTPGAGLADVDETELDYIWRAVAANKAEGIYTTLSPYWASGGSLRDWDSGIEGYPPKSDLWGLLFFNPRLQSGYRAWVKALYTRDNPYTGIPLARDPAVAIIQVQNEDSLLFWTFDGIHPQQKRLLGREFGDWVLAKYGSFDRAFTAWKESSVPQDDLGAGVLGFMQMWLVGQKLSTGDAARMADQLQFVATTQRDFYAAMEKYYRDDLGCRQLIDPSNWITANPARLNDLERWTYTPGDVMAVNRYYTGGAHIGPDDGWRIDPGDFFEDQSALTHIRHLPTNLKQVAGYPMLITESTWVNPLEYQAEAPFLVAAYQSLTGVAGYYWFTDSGSPYASPYLTFLTIQGHHPLFKWTCSVPELEGNFPAAALLYRRGYLAQGAIAVRERRTPDEMFHRDLPAIAEDPTFDPNRNPGVKAGESPAREIDPLAFLVGPVLTSYDGDGVKTVDLGKYIDPATHIVQSDTGQIKLDWGHGICVIDSPAAQGVAGFLASAGGEWNLSTVSIHSDNPYASILVVSMDGLPLNHSGRILVQVGTIARPSGWQTRPAEHQAGHEMLSGQQIISTGSLPWRIADTQVTLRLQNPNLATATLLDEAGFAQRRVPIQISGGIAEIALPPTTMYLVLQGG